MYDCLLTHFGVGDSGVHVHTYIYMMLANKAQYVMYI